MTEDVDVGAEAHGLSGESDQIKPDQIKSDQIKSDQIRSRFDRNQIRSQPELQVKSDQEQRHLKL